MCISALCVYSCNFFAVSDSLTCPDIGTSWCHSGIIEHFEIWGLKITPKGHRGSKIKSAWMLFKSMSDHPPWLKNSKNVFFFWVMLVGMCSAPSDEIGAKTVILFCFVLFCFVSFCFCFVLRNWNLCILILFCFVCLFIFVKVRSKDL